jgi:hypothetical protein
MVEVVELKKLFLIYVSVKLEVDVVVNSIKVVDIMKVSTARTTRNLCLLLSLPQYLSSKFF